MIVPNTGNLSKLEVNVIYSASLMIVPNTGNLSKLEVNVIYRMMKDISIVYGVQYFPLEK